MSGKSASLSPATTDTNVALNQPATASSTQPGNPPSHANDGKMSTRWCASNTSYPQWWQVDLSASKTLSQVDIYWLNSATRNYQYKIDVSADNVNFKTVVNQMGHTTDGNTSDSFSATARYVRLTVIGGSAGSASAYEIQVYGH